MVRAVQHDFRLRNQSAGGIGNGPGNRSGNIGLSDSERGQNLKRGNETNPQDDSPACRDTTRSQSTRRKEKASPEPSRLGATALGLFWERPVHASEIAPERRFSERFGGFSARGRTSGPSTTLMNAR